MRLTWTLDRGRDNFGPPRWRLDDESGAIVAEVSGPLPATEGPSWGHPVEKMSRRPLEFFWRGKIARRLTEPRVPPWVTRRGPEAARRAIQDIVAIRCCRWWGVESSELEFEVIREKELSK